MKIYNNQLPESQLLGAGVQRVNKPEPSGASSVSDKPGAIDKVEISGSGKKAAELMSAIRALPEVRSDKVETLKQAYEAGTYKVDSLKVAKRLLSEI